MGLEHHVSTPTAILVGSCVIGIGLYFGLRGRDAPHPGTAPDTAKSATDARSAPAASPIGLRRPPVESVEQSGTTTDVVAERAAAAILAKRGAIVERCWIPALARQPQPARARWVFNITFGADGKQITRGVEEVRDAARSDVTACMSEVLGVLEIPPPGSNAHVDVPFELP